MSRYIPDSIREQVRQRANMRCEYCGLPEHYSPESHQIEHIISRKQGGSSEIDNLANACFFCNNMKGTDVAYYEASTKKLIPLFNPRTQKWNRHFEIRDGHIIGKTAIGRATVELLKMNHPRQLEIRRRLIEAGLWESM